MTRLEAVFTELEKLPEDRQDQIAEHLLKQLDELTDDEWDRQIAEDAAAGRLDHIIEEVEADIREGRTSPLR